MAVVAEPRSDPGHPRRIAVEVGHEICHRYDVGRAHVAVIGKGIVLQRIWIGAVEAVPGKPFHIRLPGEAGAGQLVPDPGRRQRMKLVVANSPGRSRRHGEVVGQAGLAQIVIVAGDGVPIGEAADIRLGKGKLIGGVLQHDHEHMSRRACRRDRRRRSGPSLHGGLTGRRHGERQQYRHDGTHPSDSRDVTKHARRL